MKFILNLWIQPHYSIDSRLPASRSELTSYQRVGWQSYAELVHRRQVAAAHTQGLCKTFKQLHLPFYVSDQKNSRSQIGRRSHYS